MNKKLIMSMAVAAALGAPAIANAADVIFFNRDGGGAPGFEVDQFGWQAGQAICNDCTTSAGGGSAAGTLVIQAALSGLTVGGNKNDDPGTNGISYQLSIPVKTTLTGLGNAKGSALTITGTGLGSFSMYASTAGTNAFDYSSGCGFGPSQPGTCAATRDGPWTTIMSGSVRMEGAGFGAFDIIVTDATLVDLSSAGNNDSIKTVSMGGSKTFLINATSQDSGWFVSDVTALTVDANLASASFLAPMSIPRSDQILTVTPDYGSGVPVKNGTGCERGILDAAVPCDQTYSVAAVTQFFTTPEPGALGLMGLGLGILGMAVRRRRNAD